MLKGIVIGVILALIAIGGGAYFYFATGMAPVATADPMMPFEKQMAGMALQAHIEKQHVGEPPVQANEATYDAGAKIYKDHCAACHGLPGQPPVSYFSSMFPKPTQLFRNKGVTDDPPSETYWKATNGIRLSGMPSFKDALSNTQLWQVSILVANADKLPDSAKQILASAVPPLTAPGTASTAASSMK